MATKHPSKHLYFNNHKCVSALIIGFVVLAVAACGDSRRTGKVYRAEFFSMNSCLNWVKEHSGQAMATITTNKPDEVYGWLRNDAFFACVLKRTGTQGTFFEGWYDIMEESEAAGR